jgi:hypothetical protein
MGLLDRLLGPKRKAQTNPSRILVCAIGDEFAERLADDAAVYERIFTAAEVRLLSSPAEFFTALRNGRFDVAHVFCEVSAGGYIAGGPSSGADVVQACVDEDVSLLWIASDNPAEGYIAGFPAPKGPLNMVMTLNRRGPSFTRFLGELLSRMTQGEGMGSAWNAMAPQIPGADHPDTPETIAAMADPRLRLRA